MQNIHFVGLYKITLYRNCLLVFLGFFHIYFHNFFVKMTLRQTTYTIQNLCTYTCYFSCFFPILHGYQLILRCYVSLIKSPHFVTSSLNRQKTSNCSVWWKLSAIDMQKQQLRNGKSHLDKNMYNHKILNILFDLGRLRVLKAYEY